MTNEGRIIQIHWLIEWLLLLFNSHPSLCISHICYAARHHNLSEGRDVDWLCWANQISMSPSERDAHEYHGFRENLTPYTQKTTWRTNWYTMFLLVVRSKATFSYYIQWN
jgi:hypothetical protein